MAYSQRYAGGFVNFDNTRQVDATFLNNVETALLALFGVTPLTNGALVWDGMKFTAANKITNANIDAAAAIDKSKLAALAITDADVAGGAAIAKSKLNLAGTLTQTEMAAGNKITTSTMAGGPPGSPTDKDIWIATAVDANGVRWAFQYNAGSASAFKWECIGGPSLIAVEDAASTTTSTTYNQLVATVGPSVTVPRAGDYEVRWHTWTRNASAPAGNFMGIRRGAAATVDGDSVFAQVLTSLELFIGRTKVFTGLTAGTALTAEYKIGTGTGTFQYRMIDVRPVRVS